MIHGWGVRVQTDRREWQGLWLTQQEQILCRDGHCHSSDTEPSSPHRAPSTPDTPSACLQPPGTACSAHGCSGASRGRRACGRT